MKRPFIREVLYYRKHYLRFFETLDHASRKRLNWTMELISTLEWIPAPYFRQMSGHRGLYEIRTSSAQNELRVFALMDGNRIILLNGFRKKTAKTPLYEIQKARQLQAQYETEKTGA